MSNPAPCEKVKARKRRERLELIDAQIASGSLVVRKMTKAELKYWGPVKDEKAAAKRAKRRAIHDA